MNVADCLQCIRLNWLCTAFTQSFNFCFKIFCFVLFRQKICYIPTFSSKCISRTQYIPFHCIIIIMHEVTRWSKCCIGAQLWRLSRLDNYTVFFPVTIGTKSVKIHQEIPHRVIVKNILARFCGPRCISRWKLIRRKAFTLSPWCQYSSGLAV